MRKILEEIIDQWLVTDFFDLVRTTDLETGLGFILAQAIKATSESLQYPFWRHGTYIVRAEIAVSLLLNFQSRSACMGVNQTHYGYV